MHQVFLSYVQTDRARAEEIVSYLEGVGVTCWDAARDMPVDKPWAGSVARAVADCSLVLVLLSAKTDKSHEVLRELNLAVAGRKPILTVRIERIRASEDLVYLLNAQQWIDAFTAPFSNHFVRVEAAVLDLLGQGRTAGWSAWSRSSGGMGSGTSSFLRRLFGLFSTAKRVPSAPDTEADGALDARTRDSAPPAGSNTGFDVFLSYRRKDGAAVARLVRNELLTRGRAAFLDIEDLGAGHYDDKLLRYIEMAPNFVPILTPGSLASRGDEVDWMLKEIAHAVGHQKNIVPVIMPGFRFPNHLDLPEVIRALPRHNGVEFSNSYYQATVEKLISYLDS
ncbi:toll/interleukin-1 receptor domain-containing protein [bacterium]|nr:toll/interleukin-1 receptor domain-containing protein [bacterium]